MTALGDQDAYRRLRAGVVAVPAARDSVAVEGPDAASYLQGQCSQDVATLGEGATAEALLLTPQGRLQALVRVTRVGGQRFVVDVDAGFGPVVVARLLQFRLRVKVDVALLPWRCVALRGPEAVVAAGAGPPPGTELVVPFTWGDLTGVDLLGPDPAVPEGMDEASDALWEGARVEVGMPRMGAELDERTIAAEADLVDRAVSLTKGCYTGQELVARLDARGNRVARHLRGVVLVPPQGVDTGGAGANQSPAAPSPGAGAHLPVVGAALVAGERTVGSLTSVAWSPGLGRPVALAYVHRDVVPPAAVTVAPPGEAAAAAAPAWAGEVRPLPLVGTAPAHGVTTPSGLPGHDR